MPKPPVGAGALAGASPAGTSDGALPTITDGPWMNASLPPEQRTALLLRQMTQKEKLLMLVGYFGADAQWKNYTAPPEARQGSAGYVPGVARLGIPPQWQTDAGIGVATQGSAKQKRERTALPSGLATAATWNPALAERGGVMIGAEARASGFNVMLAGGVNLLRDAYNGRNFEYGGEDPYLAGVMVGAQVAGIQSNHIIATMKHYAVNDQETDRDGGNSIIEEGAARTSDLLAFQLVLERGRPGSVMCAYNKVNGVYSCENKALLTDILRTDWGYQGYVLSDWGAVHSTALAANSGLEQQSGWPFDAQPYFGALLEQALESGDVSEARLDEMVSRILWAMFEHGLFEHPASEGQAFDAAAHAALSRQDAEEGAVLLKNAGGVLPLSAKPQSIAVIGGYADRAVLSGGGSSQVYPPGGNAVPDLEPSKWPGPVVYYPSSPLAELKARLPQAKISFADGTDPAKAAQLARSSDVAIVFATQWATESIDTTIVLPDGQDALISSVARANKKTIVVLETGGPVLMPWHQETAAILEAWYPGTDGAAAIANLLVGKANPSGHLPMTLAGAASQLPHPAKPGPGDVKYAEGATVGYKWFDQQGHQPLFAFGHGLSYTSFEYSGLSAVAEGLNLTVRFTLKNSGAVTGKDVSQIYLARAGWEAPQRLGAFQKVQLKPGESKELELQVDPRLLATWDAQSHAWKIAPGPCEVRLASSSRQIHEKVTVQLAAGSVAVGAVPGK